MLPANPLLQLAPARARATVNRIESAIWKTIGPVEIEATQASPNHRPLSAARKEPLKPVAPGTHWGRMWEQRWAKLTLPKNLPKGRLYLHWEDQAEATLFHEGQPWFGLDVAHRRAPLPDKPGELWVESVVCQTGIWFHGATGIDPKGSLFKHATVLLRNETAWRAWMDLSSLLDLARLELRAHFGKEADMFEAIGTKPVIGAVPPRLRRLLHTLERAVDAFELKGPAALSAVVSKFIREHPAAPDAMRAILTGHAHIDLVWLWPEHVGDFKAVHTFSTANRLMDLYPEFRFGYSQPASYEAVGRRCPEMLDLVKRRIRQGKWEATGATWVESDTLLACGEALLRSFTIGNEAFRKLRGSPSSVLWLPDVFGYTPCLPQIMRATGVRRFYTTKLTWSAITRFPHSSFIWRGHDGSEVLAHITHDEGYSQSATPHQLRSGAAGHRQSHLHDDFLAPTGYGDGGGGVTEVICERVRRYASITGLPKTQWGGIEDFFDRLEKISADLPVHQGELYLEYHRGTYTTHRVLKENFRAAERALQIHEAVRCATRGGPIDTQPWKRVVFAQFHDYIPGSSIHEVYQDAARELPAISKAALDAATVELSHAARNAGVMPHLFNPLPIPVSVAAARADGTPARITIPPLSSAPAAVSKDAPDLKPVRVSSKRLENGRVQAVFDSQGRVRALSVDGHSLALRAPLCELIVYPDLPHQFEAWDIDRQTLALGRPVRGNAVAKVEQSTPSSATIAFTRSLGNEGSATLRYSLDAADCALRIEVEVDWKQPKRLLKLIFPTRYAGTHARYGAPFGSVLRPQVPGVAADEAQWEVPASRWAAVCDQTENEGLFVVTRSSYGFSCRDGVLGLSLVRSAAIPHGGADAMLGNPHPQALRGLDNACPFSDIGTHLISLACGLHRADAPRAETAPALADSLYTRPIQYSGPRYDSPLLGIDGGDSLLPVWAVPGSKPADGFILRLSEQLGRRGTATLLLASGWQATPVDGLGNTTGSPVTALSFSPCELISLRIHPKSRQADR